MSNLKAAVIIPTYNRSRDLEKTLECLAKQSVRDFEVLVIDNGSTDNTKFILQQYAKRSPSFKSVYEPKKNLAFLLNLGIRSCAAELLLFINDDIELPGNWFELILQAFRENPEIKLVGGPTIATRKQEIARLYESRNRNIFMNLICRFYNSVIMSGKLMEVGLQFPWGAYSIGGSEYSARELPGNRFVDILSITNVAIKREVFERVGYFDENFIFAHYDGDFFIRARRAGYKQLFCPRAWILHKVNPTGATRLAYFIGRDIGYYMVKSAKPRTLGQVLRYLAFIIYLNAFWVYKAIETGSINQLAGIWGFIYGATAFFFRKR